MGGDLLMLTGDLTFWLYMRMPALRQNLIPPTFYVFQVSSSRRLNDSHILLVAKQLIDKEDIFTLGIHLGLKHDQIEKNFKNHPESITMAVYYMLQIWFKDQNPKEAYVNIKEALKKSKLHQISHSLLK